jgi:hypothetical protein
MEKYTENRNCQALSASKGCQILKNKHLINVYLLGYKDKLDNSDNIPEYNDGLSLYAYKLGRTHVRSRIDYRLTLDEILNSIKKSQV